MDYMCSAYTTVEPWSKTTINIQWYIEWHCFNWTIFPGHFKLMVYHDFWYCFHFFHFAFFFVHSSDINETFHSAEPKIVCANSWNSCGTSREARIWFNSSFSGHWTELHQTLSPISVKTLNRPQVRPLSIKKFYLCSAGHKKKYGPNRCTQLFQQFIYVTQRSVHRRKFKFLAVATRNKTNPKMRIEKKQTPIAKKRNDCEYLRERSISLSTRDELELNIVLIRDIIWGLFIFSKDNLRFSRNRRKKETEEKKQEGWDILEHAFSLVFAVSRFHLSLSICFRWYDFHNEHFQRNRMPEGMTFRIAFSDWVDKRNSNAKIDFIDYFRRKKRCRTHTACIYWHQIARVRVHSFNWLAGTLAFSPHNISSHTDAATE